MPRTIGATARNTYKYKVCHKISDDQITTKYYTSQPEIINDTGLKRSCVYELLCNPLKRINHHNYTITKLETFLPVFDKEKTIITLSKIEY